MGEVGKRAAAAGGPRIRAPEPISDKHDLTAFDCGVPSLDDWLRQRALRSDGKSARTYVVCRGDAVVGYYCLAVGAVMRDKAPKKLRRNMPDPLPVVLIGRLAVDKNHLKSGIGSGMLKDALLRAIGIGQTAGVRAVLVHAISDDAAAFYGQYGFLPSPIDPRTLLLPLETAIEALKG